MSGLLVEPFMKLRNRILIGHLLLASLVAAIGAGGFVALGLVRGEFENAVLRTQPVMESLQTLRYLATRLTLDVTGRADGSPSGGEDAMVVDSGPLLETLDRYTSLVALHFPAERELAAEIRQYSEKLLDDLRIIASRSVAERHQTLHALTIDSYDCLSKLNEVIERAVAGERQEFEEASAEILRHVAGHTRLYLGGGLLALTLALVGGWLLSRRITAPLERLNLLAERVGRGEFEVELEDLGSDEIGGLGRSLKKMVEELQHSVVTRDYVESVIESISDGVVVVGACGSIERANTAMRALCHESIDGPLAGRMIEEVLSHDEGVDKLLAVPFLRLGFECRVVSREDAGLPVSVSASLIEFGERRGGHVLVVRERTPELTASTRPGLLSLGDHAVMLETLHAQLEKLPWRGRNIGVLLCGVDHMAELEAALGMGAAGTLLSVLGESLREVLRPGDDVGRWNHDTLVILLEDVAEVDHLGAIGQKMLNTLARPLAVKQHKVQVAVSIGIAAAPLHGMEASALIACADAAMRTARTSSGSRCVLYAHSGRYARPPENGGGA